MALANTQALLDPQQEFLVLTDALGPRKALYFTYLADGMDEQEAADKIGLQKETIRQTWKWSPKDGETFRRCLELVRANPTLVEPLKLRITRQATLNAVNHELVNGLERKDGTFAAPRSDVMRLGAEITQLVNYAPQTTVNQLNLIVRDSMGELATAMQEQLAALHGPTVVDVHDTQSLLMQELLHSED